MIRIQVSKGLVTRIKEEYYRGKSFRAIAKLLGISKNTAAYYVRHDFGTPKEYAYKCSKCDTPIKNKGRMCRACYLKGVHANSLPKPKPKPRTAMQVVAAPTTTTQKYTYHKVSAIDICPASPMRAHHWVIDTCNKGICRYCQKEKLFNRGI